MELKEGIEISLKALGLVGNCQQIAEYMKNHISAFSEFDEESLRKKVNSCLARDVKSKNPSFSKVISPKTKKPRKGVYCIARPKKIAPIIKTDKNQPNLFSNIKKGNNKEDTKIENPPVNNNFTGIDKLYFGKAGEYAVVSELLFRGYNASIMSVDVGIDVSASKNDKFFYIQVKSTLFKNDRIDITVKFNRFINSSSANIFFVVMFRYMHNNTFVNRYIILPNGHIDKFIHTGMINYNNGNMNLKIKQLNGHLCLCNGNKTEDLDYYLDNFELLN